MIIFIQLAKWFWALFPALIGIMSPSSAYNKQSNLDLQHSQLVANTDLTLDDDNNNIPDGFQYGTATDISLVNGIAKFTATAKYGCLTRLAPNVFDIVNDNTYYFYSKVKTTTPICKMLLNNVGQDTGIVSDGNWQFTSNIFTASSDYSGTGVRINDNSEYDWKPIEVDYMGAINLTAVFGNNIPDKEVLDDFILSGERFLFTDDATTDNWFNTGFTGESRDILDIVGYFFWLAIPIISIYWVFRLLLQII